MFGLLTQRADTVHTNLKPRGWRLVVPEICYLCVQGFRMQCLCGIKISIYLSNLQRWYWNWE